MLPFIIICLEVIIIIVIAVVGFWILAKIGLPEPAALIGRIVIGVICLALLVGLFVPGLGLGLALK